MTDGHLRMTYEEYRARKYLPELDGIRGLSVLLVVSVHVKDRAFISLAGYLGVVLFFILSGYLITTLALREEEDRGRVSLKAFYIRRSFRIFPLYYVVLGMYCLLILGMGFKADQRDVFIDVLPAYFFYFQEVPHSSHPLASVPFDQSWSLGIEEKFYLVWPFLAFVLLAGTRYLRTGTALLLVLLFACTPLLNEFGLPILAGCLFPYFDILIGCLLAVLLHDRYWFACLSRLAKPNVAVGLLLGYLFVHLWTPFAYREVYAIAWQYLYVVVATLLIASVILGGGPLPRWLRWKPLVYVGTISYGIYLVHLFALFGAHRVAAYFPGSILQAAISLILGSAGAIAIAAILAYLVERPCIRIGRRLAARVMDQPTIR